MASQEMTKQEIFNIWAPPEGLWSPWAKPVLFSQMDAMAVDAIAPVDPAIDIGWAVDVTQSTAIVADLPGTQGIAVALALTAVGYRPVPLFNACPEPVGDRPLVEVRPIIHALIAATPTLRDAKLPFNVPPVFVLDANRNFRIAAPAPGVFDNRSISLPTDFPSANLLISRGIRRIVLVHLSASEPRADLSHTLRRWQETGLPIHGVAIDEPSMPTPITIRRPRSFRTLWYNLLAKAGLISNPLGGFGGHLPMPSSG
jgi:hypothetical protein